MRRLLIVHSRLKRILLPMAGILLVSFNLMAKSSLTCTDRNTTLDGTTCTNTFTAADFGGDNSIHTLSLEMPGGTKIANNEISSIHVGQRLSYTISLTSTGAKLCWAYLSVENKAHPIITCPAMAELSCSQSKEILETATDTNPLRNAKATDCFGDLTVTSFDEIRNLDCQDNALNFDGNDDYITLTGLSNLNAVFTIEALVNPTAKTSYSTILSNKTAGSSNPGFFFSINDFGTNTGELVFGTQNAKIISDDSVIFGTWQHVAVTYDGTDMKMYINGAEVSVTGSVNLQSSVNDILIGDIAGSGANNYLFDGDIDELRIWNSARTNTEIASNFDRTLDGSESGLVNYYSFDQGIAEADNSNPAIDELVDGSGTINGVLSGFDLTAGPSSNWVVNRFQSNEFSQIITRTFVAVGTNGKKASCTQEIRIQRADLDDVTMPSDYSESCTTNSSTDPSVTGYPQYDPDGVGGVDAIDLIPGETGGACMLLSSFTDNEIPKCGPEQLIRRTWQVLNMCQEGTPNELITMDQLITVTTVNPTIDPIPSFTVSADLGVASAHGGCSSTAVLPMATISGLCSGQVVQSDNVVISIPGLGQVANGGSIPEPGLPLGGPYTITYRATDDCGKIGTLDVEVTVEDNTAPQCNTQNVNITLSSTGTANVGFESFDRNSSDNCSGQVWISIRRLNGLCSTGTEDDFGATVDFCCDDVSTGIEGDVMVEQLVCDKDPSLASNYSDGMVSRNSDGSPSSTFTGNCSRCMATATVKLDAAPGLTCPADVSITCAEYSATTAFGTPTVGTICSTTGLTQDFLDAGDLGCTGGTITRTHRLLSGTTVVATCDQIITVSGGVTITAPEDVTGIDCANYSCERLPPSTLSGAPTITGSACSGTAIVFIVEETNCSENNGILEFTRTWTVDPASDPDGCFTGQEFSHVVTTMANCCSDPSISFINPDDGTSASFLITNGNIADYNWTWYEGTRDNIGMPFASPIQDVPNDLEISGLSPETPYVLILTEINNSICRDTSANRTSSTQRIIGQVSTEFGTPIQNVRVALESNQAARVIGKEEVMSEAMTDEEGAYKFEGIDLPSLNKLTLVKDGDDRDNVSTRDLLIIARHILGIKEITSPYSYIAADLTGNGKISTGDMLQMQKIVLGIMDDLPNNSSWRFVKEDHVFDDMNTILDYQFPEYFTFTGDETAEELNDLNFIAVKVGDLAGAYGADLKGGTSTEQKLILQTDNQQLIPGAIIEVPIRVGDTRNISGYQHAYKFDSDKVVFTGIDFGQELQLGDNNFGYQHLSDGFLTTSWFDTEDKNLEAGTVIYKLRFEVLADAELKDVLSISSRYTQAEAYFDADKIGGVQFKFSESAGDQLVVMNAPNPFKESTQIRFDAPNSGFAVVRVSDISGREIYRSELDAVKGENQVTINKSDLQSAGVYILRLDLNGSSATQKIIMIE